MMALHTMKMEHKTMHAKVSIVTLLLLTAAASNTYAGNCAYAFNIAKVGDSYVADGVEGARSQWTSSATAPDISLSNLRFVNARIQKANNETDPSRKKDWRVFGRYQDQNNQFITMSFNPGQPIKAVGGNWKSVATDSFDREVKAKTKSPSDMTEADIIARDCVKSSPEECPYQ